MRPHPHAAELERLGKPDCVLEGSLEQGNQNTDSSSNASKGKRLPQRVCFPEKKRKCAQC